MNNLKNLAVIIAALAILLSCGEVYNTNYSSPQTEWNNSNNHYEEIISSLTPEQGEFHVYIIDSCEYVGRYSYAFTHKGNCRFCAARSKK